MKKSSEPFSMLEGTFRVVRSSPVSADRAVTCRVYEAYDFASPIAYIVESVTVRRSMITNDLKHNQLPEILGQNHLRTSVPERSTTKPNPRSFRQSGVLCDHWSRQGDLSPPGRPLSSFGYQMQRQHQVSSHCKSGRFASDATSSRGWSYPRGSQTREAQIRRVQKASRPLNKRPQSPR